jgi:two-component system, sensor histidine kinase and response regulator
VTRLSQVLNNLLSNAVKFTDQGGITVTIQNDGTPQERVRLHFTVRDTGIGVSREKLELIFQPFAQEDASTTRKYGGTGLGSSVSRRIVEMMNGTLWVESEPGVGSAFHFTSLFEIPRAGDLPDPRPRSSQTCPAIHKG